jgi:selenocysteine-specific elongation factor
MLSPRTKEPSLEIQPIVIGTAGHIDHGKSTLVRALTGIEPDRFKEEQERGLTIDLGFANFELPDGRKVGLVDVPGHERFIKNMVAGATGIDLVMLVVASDDGVMPQTREHLAIMDLLGVRRGLVVLNKIDLVEDEMVELAYEDVLAEVEGTFLEGAPILRCSGVRGDGIEELKLALSELAKEAEPRSMEGVFRMPVQRVFSAKGFGTIVTGIPVSGSVKIGESLELQPGGMRGKVRGIQAYHEKAETARAGHSTAINLSDVRHDEVERGFVLSTPGFFEPATMFGAELEVIESSPMTVSNRLAVRVHTGTTEAVGEVVVLDAEGLEPGDTGLVQLRLESPLVAAPGDRFVLRLASPSITLGGGVLIERSRHRLKRFKQFALEELKRQSDGLGSVGEFLEVTLARSAPGLVSITDLAVSGQRSVKEAAEALQALEAKELVRGFEGGKRWVHTRVFDQAIEQIHLELEGWFCERPWRMRAEAIAVRSRTSLSVPFFEVLLKAAVERGIWMQHPGGKVSLSGREPQLGEGEEAVLERLCERLQRAEFQPPSLEELEGEVGLSHDRVEALMELLVDQDKVHHVGAGVFLSETSMARAREAVRSNCEDNGELDIPTLRDQLGTTRKFLIPLLEHFDSTGLTVRAGANRVLKRR